MSPWWASDFREVAVFDLQSPRGYGVPTGTHGNTRGLIVGLLAELGDLTWG
jgi:hypothetical protein